MPKNGGLRKRIVRIVGGLLVVALVYCGFRFGKDVLNLWRSGILGDVLSKQEQRKYEGTSQVNLKAIYTALIGYHDSEGQFPDASGWMDEAKKRIKTADLAKEEAIKKLINPLALPAREGVYGYAMNDAVSRRFKDDIKTPDETPLVFASKQTGWNAHGDPKTDKAERSALAVTVSGKIIVLK